MKPLTATPERAILSKRPCKHCKSEIYLQFMKITPQLECWISFDGSDGKLHHCPARLLALEVKKLIQTAINQMNSGSYIHTQNTTTNTEVIHTEREGGSRSGQC